MPETLNAPETTEQQPQTTGEPPMPEQALVGKPQTAEQPAAAESADQQVAPSAADVIIPTHGISLTQPWASLVACGAKRIETRSWPTNVRGPIAILATKTLKLESDTAFEDPVIAKVMAELGIAKQNIPLGGIVAVADLVDCFQFAEGYDPGEPEKHFGHFAAGRHGFKLEKVRALPALLPCAGAHKIFALPADAVAELTKVLTAPAAMPGALEDVPTLDWKYQESNKTWSADSIAQKGTYFVDEVDGKWSLATMRDGSSSDEIPNRLDSLDAAKAWCAAREVELFNASRKPTEAEPAPSPAPAEEKVGSAGQDGGGAPDPHTWELIQNAREDEREAEAEVTSLSESLKAAKKRHEFASAPLGKLIDEAKFPNLFTAQKTTQKQDKKEVAADACEKTFGNIPNLIPADDDAWKSVTLEELGIKSSRVLKALHEHTPEIRTHGELSAWQEKKTQYWATDIKGLGDKGKEEIENAQFAYWQAHPRMASPPAEKPQDQKADGPAALVWETENDNEGKSYEWRARNTVGITYGDSAGDKDFAARRDPSGLACAYFIERLGTGGFEVECNSSIGADPGGNNPFPTLESAQQWCQQQNDAAWTRLRAKTESDGQLHPRATDGEKVQSPDPISAGSLGLTEDAIRKAFYPKLLEASRGDALPIITETIEVDGVLHIAIPASLMDSASYVLTPLLDQRDDAVVTDNDRYGGIAVKRGGGTLWLGPAQRSIRVTVKTAPIKLPPPEAMAAAVATTAEQAGDAAIDADKAKGSKRGKNEAAAVGASA